MQLSFGQIAILFGLSDKNSGCTRKSLYLEVLIGIIEHAYSMNCKQFVSVYCIDDMLLFVLKLEDLHCIIHLLNDVLLQQFLKCILHIVSLQQNPLLGIVDNTHH